MDESTPTQVQSKTCTKCKKTKPVTEFYRSRKSYQGQCKLCKKVVVLRWREANPDYDAKYYLKHREKIISATREYARLNPVDPERRRQRKRKWKQANADRIAEVNRAWKANNPDLVRESSLRCANRRRARLQGLPAESYDLSEILERDGTACVLCGNELDFNAKRYESNAVTIEHLECISWPDSAGDVLSNVALSHWSCNVRRGTSAHPAAARKRAELLSMERCIAQ